MMDRYDELSILLILFRACKQKKGKWITEDHVASFFFAELAGWNRKDATDTAHGLLHHLAKRGLVEVRHGRSKHSDFRATQAGLRLVQDALSATLHEYVK